MNRRTFLGAAAALALQPEPASGETPEVEVSEDEEYGCGHANVNRTTTAWSALELFESVDENAELGANGYWSDDEGPHVEVTATTDLAQLVISMPPEDARAFAADLRAAAAHAEQGDARMGDSDA